jgi:hypothetical protein
MDNKTEERLRNLFSEASGEASSKPPGGARASDAEETPAAEDRSHADSAADYTSAPAGASSFDASLNGGAGQSYHGTSGSASASGSGSGGGIGSTLESVAGDIFGGALGLIPLVGSLFGLFDSNSTPQPVFQKYEMPSSISFGAADTSSGGLANADYGQMGLPRLYDSSDSGTASPENGTGSGSMATNAPVPAVSSAPAASSSQDPSSGSPGSVTAGGGGSGMPQISVNVQAMDAQSFMSYSGEIAKAVRDAMLNLSSINDVVTEL